MTTLTSGRPSSWWVIRIERGIGVDCEDPLIVRNPQVNIPPALVIPLETDRFIQDDGFIPAARRGGSVGLASLRSCSRC